MSDSIDCELIALINRLNKIQKEIGGGKKDKGSHNIGGFLTILIVIVIILEIFSLPSNKNVRPIRRTFTEKAVPGADKPWKPFLS